VRCFERAESFPAATTARGDGEHARDA